MGNRKIDRCCMSATFSRSMRSLAADVFRRSIWGTFFVVALLGVWGVWLFCARVRLYEVTEAARLEVDQAVHPVAAAVAGRVAATYLILGKDVQVGDVLVELDMDMQRLQLGEERTRLASLPHMLKALHDESQAEAEAQRKDDQMTRWALDQAHARYQEAAAAVRLSGKEVKQKALL